MTWETVDHVKSGYDLPLVLKGIAAVEDALEALEHGVDVIYVSNHGGRQLDPALVRSVEALVEPHVTSAFPHLRIDERDY